MSIEFKTIDVDSHFHKCYEFRKDSYYCSFGKTKGYDKSVSGYEGRIRERLNDKRWFYYHVWQDGKIIGQLEFRSYSQFDEFGYINLMYLIPEYRGVGIADNIHKYIIHCLISAKCYGAVLSVSRTNTRALKFYKRNGWQFHDNNPKHETTDFYKNVFST